MLPLEAGSHSYWAVWNLLLILVDVLTEIGFFFQKSSQQPSCPDKYIWWEQQKSSYAREWGCMVKMIALIHVPLTCYRGTNACYFLARLNSVFKNPVLFKQGRHFPVTYVKYLGNIPMAPFVCWGATVKGHVALYQWRQETNPVYVAHRF